MPLLQLVQNLMNAIEALKQYEKEFEEMKKESESKKGDVLDSMGQ